MLSRAAGLIAAFILFIWPLTAVAADAEVDLELVLAVDVSRSMDIDELDVQREGYVAAFLHQDVIKAITSGPVGRIAVTYIEWAGPQSQTTVIPWTLNEPADLEAVLESGVDGIITDYPDRLLKLVSAKGVPAR